VGFISAAILVIIARGPWEEKWVGWRGGWSMIKKDKDSADGKTADKEMHGRIVPRDEEVGVDANEKVLQEVAAEEGHESPLRDENDGKESRKEGEVRETKV
jgi:hypothetical protein